MLICSKNNEPLTAVIVKKIQQNKIDISMDDKLLKYFLKIQPLLENEIEAIDETKAIKHFKKGTVLLKEGQTSTEAYFVVDGIIKTPYHCKCICRLKLLKNEAQFL